MAALAQLWGAVVVAGLAGCTSGGDSLNETTGSLPTCAWPAGLGTLDASVDGACTAARAYLACGSEDYLSNDLGGSTCKDACGPGEYAVGCGGPGPGAKPSPPSGSCRTLPPNPGGEVFACCPCN